MTLTDEERRVMDLRDAVIAAEPALVRSSDFDLPIDHFRRKRAEAFVERLNAETIPMPSRDAEIVRYLRSDAAKTLWLDMPRQRPEYWPQWEAVAEVLEAYADAIERGDYRKDG